MVEAIDAANVCRVSRPCLARGHRPEALANTMSGGTQNQRMKVKARTIGPSMRSGRLPFAKPGMRVARVEVELACDQDDDGLDGGQSGEATSAALGGLKQAVDGLQEAIGLTGVRPRDDAIDVAAHKRGDILHRLDLGAQ